MKQYFIIEGPRLSCRDIEESLDYSGFGEFKVKKLKHGPHTMTAMAKFMERGQDGRTAVRN